MPRKLNTPMGENHCRWIKDRVELALKNKISAKWRGLLKRVLNKKNQKKTEKTEVMLGYTASELREHLELQFLDGMSWENHGKTWHIDHIRPISSFSTDADASVVNSLKNLRPLWASDNLKKYKKWGER